MAHMYNYCFILDALKPFGESPHPGFFEQGTETGLWHCSMLHLLPFTKTVHGLSQRHWSPLPRNFIWYQKSFSGWKEATVSLWGHKSTPFLRKE